MGNQKSYIFNGSFSWKDFNTGADYSFSPTNIYMVEDINDFTKTLVMEFVEDEGVNEFVGLWKHKNIKNHKQLILYGNFLEKAEALKCCIFYIQDVIVENIDTESRIFKKVKVICTECIDNVLSIGPQTKKGYKNKTAQYIFKDLLKKEVVSSMVTLDAPIWGEKELNIPLFLNPYWSISKILKYISNNYVIGGPAKFINSYTHNKGILSSVKLGMYPLQYLMDGKFGNGGILKVEPDNTNTNGIHVDYYIHGPSRFDRVYKDFKEQSIYVMSEFEGIEPSQTTLDDFNTDKDIVPEFESNDERGYITPLFTNLLKNAERTVKLGSIINEDEISNSISSTNMKIECEPKPIVQHKLLNSFYQYYSQNFILECIVAPSSNLKIGYVYYIKLPSRNQQNNFGIEDKTLSGNWLLSRIEHNIRHQGERYTYMPKCYFIRTGLENSPVVDKEATKVDNKSLQDNKPKINETNKDKIGTMKSISSNKIKQAKQKISEVSNSVKNQVAGATSAISNGISNGISNATSGASSAISSATSGISTGYSFLKTKIGIGVSGVVGSGNVSSKVTTNGISNTISTVSTKLSSGESAYSGLRNKSNIVDVATKINKSEIVSSDGDVKVIDGDLTVNGTSGDINGLVKGTIVDNKVSGEMLSNYDNGSGNKIIVGSISGEYDPITRGVKGEFTGNEIEDHTDEEIQEGIKSGDEFYKKWFIK